MYCSPLFDAEASFSFLDDDDQNTQIPPINVLFSTIDNSPSIKKVGFEILDSANSAEIFPCLASLCRAWARITRSRSFQEPIHVVELIDDWQAMIWQIQIVHACRGNWTSDLQISTPLLCLWTTLATDTLKFRLLLYTLSSRVIFITLITWLTHMPDSSGSQISLFETKSSLLTVKNIQELIRRLSRALFCLVSELFIIFYI